jgi:hypothetical protein
MPNLFPGAAERQNNIIVRPTSTKVHFVQFDDLDGTALSRGTAWNAAAAVERKGQKAGRGRSA